VAKREVMDACCALRLDSYWTISERVFVMVSRLAGGIGGDTIGGTDGEEVLVSTPAEASELDISDTKFIGSLILPRLRRV
jgi:hypothetical protein